LSFEYFAIPIAKNDHSVGRPNVKKMTAHSRRPTRSKAAGARVQLGVSNLADQQYISTVGSNGFSNSNPTGTGQTLLTSVWPT